MKEKEVSKLENAELITRMASNTECRTTDITLTEKGKLLAIEAAQQRTGAEEWHIWRRNKSAERN